MTKSIYDRPRTIVRNHRFRLYPNPAEKRFLEGIFGAWRVVYNYYLAENIKAYKTKRIKIHLYQQTADIKHLRQREGYEWLADHNSRILQLAVKNLHFAYKIFFTDLKDQSIKGPDKRGFPAFKTKETRQSFQIDFVGRGLGCIQPNSTLSLPKLHAQVYGIEAYELMSMRKRGECPPGIKVKLDRPLEGKLGIGTITKEPTGKYFVTIPVTQVIQTLPEIEKADQPRVGIDVGIDDLITLSNGIKIPNPGFLEQSIKKLGKAQRKLARLLKGGKNYEKQRKKVARIHEKIKNQRRDFLHKLTTELVRTHQAIFTEDLDIKRMLRGENCGEHLIRNAAWGKLIRMLEYKSEEHGVEFDKADRFFPSSQLCNSCGHLHSDLKPDDKEWRCPACGQWHDRNVNAAQNILKECEKNI